MLLQPTKQKNEEIDDENEIYTLLGSIADAYRLYNTCATPITGSCEGGNAPGRNYSVLYC